MKTLGQIGVFCLTIVTVGAQIHTPPSTRREEVVETLHGVEVKDPYRWLEDQNAPATRAWLDAQNAYAESVLAGLPGRERIRTRVSELLKVDSIEVPLMRGNRYFFARRRASQDLPILYMREGLRGTDQVLVDPHPMSADQTVSVSFLDISHDGQLLAYGARAGGEDEVIVRLLDVDRRKELADVLPKGRYSSLTFTRDKSAVYYSRHTPNGPRVFLHTLGTNPLLDREVFGEGHGPDKIITLRVSSDRRVLLISVARGSAARKTELYLLEPRPVSRRWGTSATAASPAIKTLVNDVDAAFTATFGGDQLFLRTNWKAPNYKVLAVDLRNSARERWRQIVPEGKTVMTGLTAAGGKLLVSYLEDVQPRVRIYSVGGRWVPRVIRVRDLPFRSIGSLGSISADWDRNEVFVSFSSLIQPTTISRHDLDSGHQEVWARLAAPVDTANIEIQQVWYPSKDGTKIPMFVARRKDQPLDGTNPTLLTGYGGFNASQTPGFSYQAALWLERGGIYALANLRGGGEFGEGWHRAGMLANKQNVFDDFIAAAEWLIQQKYTTPSKLAISGASNGGLLVGAAMTQRPELFQAVVCGYPLLDMVRYHRFLVARYWIPEYGSAEDDPQQFKYLQAYSPYHRVTEGVRYPAVLFVTGDSDTRVAPLHARKMTARLQAASSAIGRPILLRSDTKAGHSAGIPVTKRIEQLTDEIAFLFWQVGIRERQSDRAVIRPSPTEIDRSMSTHRASQFHR